ncbi:MAG: hypothetical protein HY290_30240 [Planctomycetia bacterium]|nr:hypothetical protein [Planctomycetia bacterium]
MPDANPHDGASVICPMCGGTLTESSALCGHCGEAIAKTSAAVRGFRWRLIPTALLACYATVMTLGGVLSMAVSAFASTTSLTSWIAHGIFGIGSGLLSGFAAFAWWKGRWRIAVALTVVTYPISLLMLWLSGEL